MTTRPQPAQPNQSLPPARGDDNSADSKQTGHHHTHAPFLCRDCLQYEQTPKQAYMRCPACNSPRILQHPELDTLSVAHMDCDAFYASIEKRDDPSLRSKAVIVGGGSARGVVSTACYIARLSGVRSAMPMYQARKLCPDAVIIKPDMAKYKAASLQMRAMMDSLTPLVEPLSLDEAFLDLSGTHSLHHGVPALSLARLVKEIEATIGITISVGLAPNKFLAKLASDMKKPRGFSVIGAAEAQSILGPMPISRIFGIGKKTAHTLERDGLTYIHQLQTMDEKKLIQAYGETGQRLYRLARAEDNRKVTPHRPVKSISGETTFSTDISDRTALEAHLWAQSERVSKEAKRKEMAGKTITLKLKTRSHRIITRARTLSEPTQLADMIFKVSGQLLDELANGTAYRLLGVGLSNFAPLTQADQPDLIDPQKTRRIEAERAMDKVRARFGNTAVQKGRSLQTPPKKPSQTKS